ncbi:Agamous-like MADS-box protein AGL82 [Bienertia sinuspersici]
MGRAKIAMEFIKKEKTRNTTYAKRKKGLLKKCHELSILCNAPTCIILYPYKEGKQPLEVEVYSYKGDNDTAICPIDSSRAKDPKIAREIIDRYLMVPKEERNKITRAKNLYDMFDEWTKKANQDLSKLRHKNAMDKYSSWGYNHAYFDGLDVVQLMEVLVHLDQKIEYVNQRINMMIKSNHNHNEVGLVPYFEPTPISTNLMIPQFEGVNQIPLFNYYPIINNNNQEYCHQIMPFNNQLHHQQNNAFIDQVVGASSRMMDDHHHHHDGNKNNNMVMYNMNMMHYDQGSEIVDNIGSTSSYGDGLAMSMPLQLPVMQHNVSLPRQRQYYQQMFYK